MALSHFAWVHWSQGETEGYLRLNLPTGTLLAERGGATPHPLCRTTDSGRVFRENSGVPMLVRFRLQTNGRYELMTQGTAGPSCRRYRSGLDWEEAVRVAFAWLDRRYTLAEPSRLG